MQPHADPMFGTELPDPDRDAQFYEGVPAKRLVAWVVDFLIIGIFALIATMIFGLLTLGFGVVMFPVIMITVGFAYRTLTIASQSSTWGMRLVGIELRSRTGDRFDLLHAAIHTAIFMFLMASIIGWAATVISIAATRYNQGIPDLILGTTAINTPL